MNIEESKIKSGKQLLTELDKMKPKPKAAFWVYVDDIHDWKLGIYISSTEGPKKAYREIQKILRKKKDLDLGLDQISIFKNDAPLLSLMSRMISTGEGISGIRMSGNVVNGQPLPDSYVYRMNIKRPTRQSR